MRAKKPFLESSWKGVKQISWMKKFEKYIVRIVTQVFATRKTKKFMVA